MILDYLALGVLFIDVVTIIVGMTVLIRTIRKVSALHVSYLMGLDASLKRVASSVLTPEEAARRQAEQLARMSTKKAEESDPYEEFVSRVIPSQYL